MPPNAERPTSVESRENVHRSVRVFAVAGIQVGQLEEMLKEGKPPDEIPLVEVIVAQKSDSNMVTAIGGEIENGKDLLHVAMDMVFRKSLLTRESRRKLEDHVGQEEPIPYIVNGWHDTFQTFCVRVRGRQYHREALLTLMPVRSAAISLHEPREDVDPTSVYKINQLVHFSPDELLALVDNGTVTTSHGETYKIFGHLTRASAGDVKMTEVGRQAQKKELNRMLGEINEYEQTIRAEMIAHINRERRYDKKPSIRSLGECTHAEISRGFLSAKMVLGMQDEKIRDEKRENKPPKAADLTTAALYLREFFPWDLPKALSTAMPREVLHAAGVLKYALRGTVIGLYEKMGRDVTKPFDVVGALRAIWPNVIEQLRKDGRVELIKELDDLFIDGLVAKLGKSREIIRRAMQMPERLSNYLAGEMQKTKDTFQEHHPSNEAASAIERPFVQMLYILGLHPYINIPHEEIAQNQTFIQTRGEILMQLAVVFTALPVVERHLYADNSLFESGLTSFFELPRTDEIFLHGVPHKISRRKSKAYIGDRQLELWHDKRPLKSEERSLMKSFQESAIHDDFSHNFVILDENYSANELRDIPMRLNRARLLGEELLAHFQKIHAGAGLTASIVPGTHKTVGIQSVQDFIEITSKKERIRFVEEKKNGKRPGSFGNSIVREKFVLSLKKDDREYFTEICIYPFETIELEGTVLKSSDFMGFIEKLLDDASGRHAGYRLVQTDPDDPTAPSVLELVRPATWYPSLFNSIKFHQHTPEKKKRIVI